MDDLFGPIMFLVGVAILGGVLTYGILQRKREAAGTRRRDLDRIAQIREERR